VTCSFYDLLQVLIGTSNATREKAQVSSISSNRLLFCQGIRVFRLLSNIQSDFGKFLCLGTY
jgi:hypothetical protein